MRRLSSRASCRSVWAGALVAARTCCRPGQVLCYAPAAVCCACLQRAQRL